MFTCLSQKMISQLHGVQYQAAKPRKHDNIFSSLAACPGLDFTILVLTFNTLHDVSQDVSLSSLKTYHMAFY